MGRRHTPLSGAPKRGKRSEAEGVETNHATRRLTLWHKRLRYQCFNIITLTNKGGETGSTEVKKLKLHAEVLTAR
jgi:hypothetical protein